MHGFLYEFGSFIFGDLVCCVCALVQLSRVCSLTSGVIRQHIPSVVYAACAVYAHSDELRGWVGIHCHMHGYPCSHVVCVGAALPS